jgi:hypothetical protein
VRLRVQWRALANQRDGVLAAAHRPVRAQAEEFLREGKEEREGRNKERDGRKEERQGKEEREGRKEEGRDERKKE